MQGSPQIVAELNKLLKNELTAIKIGRASCRERV